MFDEELELPRDLGSYTLLRRLAVGGMAEVYVAKTNGLEGFEKQVAIKLIHPRYSDDEHFVQMLVQEAKVAVQLTHVNIAQTFDLGRAGEQYYIVMELIEGADAYRVMRKCAEMKRAMPIDVATFIVAEMLQGLDYAHRKSGPDGRPLNIVHRDISPQNVLISHSGEVKLVDFGIAKAASRSEQTEAGVIKGKYYYMSPEHAWGDPIDHRADIFSTGVVLYELLTGRMLYTDENVVVLLDKVRKADIAPPERRRPSIPKALSDIVMRALAKSPGERYQSAQEFAGALQQFLYQASPTFSSARLGELMGNLFPEEAQRHSGSHSLPPVSDQVSLLTPVPAKPAAQPQRGASMEDFDDEEESTRHDVLPFKRGAAKPAAAPVVVAPPARPAPQPTMRPQKGRDASQPTAKLAAPLASPAPATAPRNELEGPTATDEQTVAGEWEDPTHLKDRKDEFDDSTLVDSGGMARELDAMLKVAPPKGQPQVFESGRGRVHASFVKPSAPKAPQKPPAQKAPSVPPPPSAGAWNTAKQPAMPASRPLAISAPPAPRPPPQPAAGTQTTPFVAPRGQLHAADTALVTTPRDAPDPTQPYMKGAPPQWQAPPLAFSQPPPHPAMAFTSSTGPYASVPVPGADPFAAAPPIVTQPADLGRPRPWRWLGAVIGLVMIAVGAAFVVSLMLPPPPPPTLEIVSSPPGATVLLDGAPLPGVTPLSLGNGLEPGRSYSVEVRLAGYQSWTATFVATAGTTRQEVPLVLVATVLHVETTPPGAAIMVDGASAGMSPLDLPSMRVGQHVVVRATLTGFAPAQVTVVIGEGTTPATLTLEPLH